MTVNDGRIRAAACRSAVVVLAAMSVAGCGTSAAHSETSSPAQAADDAWASGPLNASVAGVTAGSASPRPADAPVSPGQASQLQARSNATFMTITARSFEPGNLTVAAGSRLTVTNRDSRPHTWTSDRGYWDSGPIAPGASFSVDFLTPGTFAFHDSTDGALHGTVTVLEPSSGGRP